MTEGAYPKPREPRAWNQVPDFMPAGHGDPAMRQFTRIVQAGRSGMELYDVDGLNHIAEGILSGCGTAGYRCSLSLDPRSSILKLAVDLGHVGSLKARQLVCLLRLQSQARMARLDYDTEDHRLWIHAGSLCVPAQSSSQVLHYLFRDIRGLLTDDRLSVVH